MQSDRTLRKWYRYMNRRFFDNELPDNVCVRWADETEEKEVQWEQKYFGWADKCRGKYADGYHTHYIVLSRVKNVSASLRLSTLAHEMIHIATDIRDDHGPAFERWRELIAERGIFKKHAVHKNTTLF